MTLATAQPWVVAVVDDEPGIHEVTRLVLRRLKKRRLLLRDQIARLEFHLEPPEPA